MILNQEDKLPQPNQEFKPININELSDVVQSHSHIRAVGAGHSFSPLAKTDEVLLNLDQFKGIVAFYQ